MRFSKQNHSRIPMPGKPGTCRLQVRDLGVTLEGESQNTSASSMHIR